MAWLIENARWFGPTVKTGTAAEFAAGRGSACGLPIVSGP
jgi:hypothetical protein